MQHRGIQHSDTTAFQSYPQDKEGNEVSSRTILAPGPAPCPPPRGPPCPRPPPPLGPPRVGLGESRMMGGVVKFTSVTISLLRPLRLFLPFAPLPPSPGERSSCDQKCQAGSCPTSQSLMIITLRAICNINQMSLGCSDLNLLMRKLYRSSASGL